MTASGSPNEVVQLFTGDTSGIEAAAAKAVETSVRAAQKMESEAKRSADTQLQVAQRAAAARAEVRAREFEANGRQLQADLARVAAAYERQIRMAQSAAERESLVKLRGMDVKATIERDAQIGERAYAQAGAKRMDARRREMEGMTRMALELEARANKELAARSGGGAANASGGAGGGGLLWGGGFSPERAMRIGGALVGIRLAIDGITAAQAAWNAKAAENAGNIEKAHAGYMGVVETIRSIPLLGDVLVRGVDLVTGQVTAIRKMREEMERLALVQKAMLDTAEQLRMSRRAAANESMSRRDQGDLLALPEGSQRDRLAIEQQGAAAMRAAQQRLEDVQKQLNLSNEQKAAVEALKNQARDAMSNPLRQELQSIDEAIASVAGRYRGDRDNVLHSRRAEVMRAMSNEGATDSQIAALHAQADKIRGDASNAKALGLQAAQSAVAEQPGLNRDALRRFDEQAARERQQTLRSIREETTAIQLDTIGDADAAALVRMDEGFQKQIDAIRAAGLKEEDERDRIAAVREQREAARQNLWTRQTAAREQRHAAEVAQAAQQAAQRNAAMMAAAGGPNATSDMQAQTRIAALQLMGQTDPRAAMAAQILASNNGFDRQIRDKQKLMEDAAGTPAADAIKAQIGELQKQSQIAAAGIMQGSFAPARFVGLGDAWKQIQSSAAGGKADIDKKMLDGMNRLVEKLLPDILTAAQRQTAIGGF